MSDKKEGKAYGIAAEDEPGLRFDLFVCFVYTKLNELPKYHRKKAFDQLTEGTTYQIVDIRKEVLKKFDRDSKKESW